MNKKITMTISRHPGSRVTGHAVLEESPRYYITESVFTGVTNCWPKAEYRTRTVTTAEVRRMRRRRDQAIGFAHQCRRGPA